MQEIYPEKYILKKNQGEKNQGEKNPGEKNPGKKNIYPENFPKRSLHSNITDFNSEHTGIPEHCWKTTVFSADEVNLRIKTTARVP